MIGLIILLPFSFQVEASDVSLEKDLRRDLEESRSILKVITQKLGEGASFDKQIVALKDRAEDITASHLLLLERFRLREETIKPLGQTAQERHAAMFDKYREAIEEYLSLVGGLSVGETVPESVIDRLQSLLDQMLPKRKLPIFGTLPYRNLNYPPKEPVRTPAIKPGYKGGNTAVTPDDLKSTLEAPLSEDIATLAQSLNWNPVSIYEWVKNGVETEWYWGCMKGAEETLRQASGNDCDQASLLLALLRASGFPSRYVRGVIEIEAERLKNLIGIDDENLMAQFFQKSGIPFTPVIKGGKISAFEIEHIWVESQIPFANFHGAVVDEHGKAWLGLDTSIKVTGYTYNSPIDILQELPLSGIRDEYLSAVQTKTPLEYIRTAVTTYLDSAYPGKTYEDALRTKTLIPEVMDILPASMQYGEVVVTREYTAIPDDLLHKVRFVATDMANTDLFDITLETLNLSNREILLSYEPETIEDQETLNFYGGLDNTPAYLVRLRPVLNVKGERVIVGRDGLPMGSDYRLTLELLSPNGMERVSSTHITGDLTAIGIVSQRITEVSQPETPNAGNLLYQEAKHYIDRWNQAEEELSSLMLLAIARPIPTVATLGGVIDVTYLLDSPHVFEWKGVFVDANLRTIEVAGRGIDFMKLSSLQGSVLENKIFEEDFQVDSISTAKLFGLASATEPPIEIVTIDQSNIDIVLPTLPFDENIKEDITNAVNEDLVVRIPKSETVYENWTGVGYIKEDPVTGESGYMLSGMIAGGMTVGDWPDDLLSLLSSPYSKPANTDPASAYQVYKIAATDFQKGTAGEKLAQPLKVMVLDIKGNPVSAADVTFTVKGGEGKVGIPAAGAVTVATDGKGIASVEFTLGEKTGVNPRYMWKNPGDDYPQQVGENIVDASLSSGKNLPKPFTAYGFPKEPSAIKKRFGDLVTMPILTFAGFVSAVAEDMYGNPVSNIPVDFAVLPAKELSTCANPNKDTRPALLIDVNDPCFALAVVPTWGDCASGKASMQEKTSPFGVSAHLIMGGIPNAEYPIKASYGSLSTVFTRYTGPFGSCDDPNAEPSLQLFNRFIYPADSFGKDINGVEAGQEITFYMRLYFLREAEKIGTDCSGKCPKIVGARQYGIDTNFESAQVSASGQPCIYLGAGRFKCQYKVSKGLNTIAIDGTAGIKRPKYDNHCPSCGALISETVSRDADETMTVYGVEVGLELGPESFILVDGQGYSVKDYTLTAQISPPEYQAESAFIVIKEDGKPKQYVYLGASIAEGIVTLLKGYYFDPKSVYTAQAVLNMGRVHQGRSLEIWSPEIPLKVYSTQIETEDLKLVTNVDRINGDICAAPKYLKFFIASDAEVTIEVDGTVIEQTVGGQTILIKDFPFPAGVNQVEISREMVPLPGEHDFKITAVFSKANPRIESSATGKIVHEITIDAFLPVGHTFIKGVDIQDGHFSYSKEDLSISGIGPSLNFTRSYGSTGQKSSGAVGAGWTHNHDSRLIIDDCLRITVIGGGGNGIRFSNPVSQGGDLRYKPQAGYHGSLIRHPDGYYDFYTKGRARYHYEQSPDPAKSKEFTLRFVEDTNGNRLTLLYDAKPPFNLVSVQDASGRTLEFQYDHYGEIPEDRIVKITGPLGLEVKFEYDKYGNLTKATRDVRVETYTYTTTHPRDKHNLTQIVDPNGNITEIAYYQDQDSISGYPVNFDWMTHILIFPEKFEYVKSVKEASGKPEETSTSFKYDYVNSTRTVTNARGYDDVYKLNAYGSVIEITDPLGYTSKTKWAMDAGINDVYILENTDAEGNTTKYEYDVNGNITKTTDAMGHSTQTDYDLICDLPIKMTDPNGHISESTYDGKCNLQQTNDPMGNTTTHVYDAQGKTISTTDADGKTTVYTYDLYGNVSTTTDPEGGMKTTVYDERGRLLKVVDANGHQTIFSYNALDKQLKEVNHLGFSQTRTYDYAGNRTSTTDANGHTTTYVYDGMNRLVKETDALGYSRRFEYDGNGNRVKAIDKKGYATTYVYDERDKLTKQTNAEGKGMTFSYDKVGNKVQEVNYNGFATTYTYDGAYRLVKVENALKHAILYEYDNARNKTKETDPNNHETRFVNDAANRLVSRIDALGNSSTIEYDGVGNITKTTDRNGNATSYEYDGSKRLLLTTNALGFTVRYSYDKVGNKKTKTDQNGNTTAYEYDEVNRAIKETGALGYVTEIKYDPVGNVTRMIDSKGNEITKEYDEVNQLIKIRTKEPLTGKWIDLIYTYDANGNKLAEKNGRGFTTQYSYDKLNRLTSVTDALGRSTSYEYDAMGNKTKEVDKKGIVTTYVYDELNHLKEEIRKGVTTHSHEYDPAGNHLSETDANGKTTFYQYDSLNRVVKKISPLALQTVYTYDKEGNKLTETNPEGETITYAYDKLNRPVSVEDAEGNVTSYEYDKVGNKTKKIEPMGPSFAIEFRYDGRNRLSKVIDGYGNTTEYAYDENDNRLSEKDANGNVVGYEYDSLNRLKRVIQHKAGGDLATEFEYDENGNRTALADPEGQKIVFTYDALDRLGQKVYPAPKSSIYPYLKTISYQYDSNNNLERIDEVKVISSSGQTVTETTTKTYDDFNRLASTTDRNNKTISYTYDNAGNRKTVTDPDGKVTTYIYDDLNRVTSVQTEDGLTSYTYYPDGVKHETLYPNGTGSEYTYDKSNRVTRIRNYNSSGDLSLYEYTYDKNGSRLSMEETQNGVKETTTYEYDLINRLTKVAYPADGQYPNGRTAHYTYDGLGNRLTETAKDNSGLIMANRSYTYDDVNRLMSITDLLGTDHVTFEYDKNGNTVSKVRGGIKTDYLYDPKDYLRVVSQGGSNIAAFDYNHEGMRIGKSGAGGEVRYIYDDRSVLMEIGSSGNTVAKYNYGDHLISLKHVTQGTQFYLFSDLGSVSNLTNPDGSERCSYRYDAWGNFRENCAGSWNRKTFTGKEWDEETGLYYFGARFYDPEIGRFISQDVHPGEIATPPSLHRYLYAYANPLRYVDLSGYSVIEPLSTGGKFLNFITAGWYSRHKLDNEFNALHTKATEALQAGDIEASDAYIKKMKLVVNELDVEAARRDLIREKILLGVSEGVLNFIPNIIQGVANIIRPTDYAIEGLHIGVSEYGVKAKWSWRETKKTSDWYWEQFKGMLGSGVGETLAGAWVSADPEAPLKARVAGAETFGQGLPGTLATVAGYKAVLSKALGTAKAIPLKLEMNKALARGNVIGSGSAWDVIVDPAGNPDVAYRVLRPEPCDYTLYQQWKKGAASSEMGDLVRGHKLWDEMGFMKYHGIAEDVTYQGQRTVGIKMQRHLITKEFSLDEGMYDLFRKGELTAKQVQAAENIRQLVNEVYGDYGDLQGGVDVAGRVRLFDPPSVRLDLWKETMRQLRYLRKLGEIPVK